MPTQLIPIHLAGPGVRILPAEQLLEYAEDFWKTKTYKDSSPDTLKILQTEGPKYQVGAGCLTDGMIGENWAKLYGIETLLNESNVLATLHSIYQFNYKANLSNHANAQRPGYAIGQEGGEINCTWPKGNRPSLPFIYSDEIWPGSEYQAATHMLQVGLIKEGMTIVKTLRARFNGQKRNPWDEYECGSYYARSMASYALLQSLSGFRYSTVTHSLWFSPYTQKRSFRCFFSTESAYGEIILEEDELRIELLEGELLIKSIYLNGSADALSNASSWKAHQGEPLSIALSCMS